MGFKTQRDVERLTLPPGQTELLVFDERCPGLGIRIQGASRRWIVRYPADGGRRRKMVLGPVPGLSLDDARRRATEIVQGARGGVDALAERRKRKVRQADTFRTLVGIYLERYAEKQQRPRTLLETRRALKKHAATLHSTPLEEIGRHQVAELLFRLASAAGPIAANRARAALSHCFAWAMQAGLADANPVIGTARPGAEVKRDRVLSPDELGAIWRACGEDDHGRIVRLLLLTAQRRQEVGAMGWSEVDLDGALWTLPGARAKNGREHLVPLSGPVRDILRQQQRERDEQRQRDADKGIERPERDLIFGSRRGPFSGWSDAKEALDRRIAKSRATAAGCDVIGPGHSRPEWRLNDLRRTAVTMMAEMGIAPHVIEAIVNHVSGHRAGVAGVYNRAVYAAEKRLALARWAEELTRIVDGPGAITNVVERRSGGRAG